MTDLVKGIDTSEGRSVVVYIPLAYNAASFSNAMRDEFLVTYKDLGSEVPSLAGMGTITYPISGRYVERWRERSPFDDPPGEGYKTLAMAGRFVQNKPYFHGHWTFDTSNIWRTNYAVGYPVGEYPARLSVTNPVNYGGWERICGNAIDEARDAAITNLYGSLHRRQDMALGVFLAELKESFELLGKSLMTIYLVIKALKKGRVTDALAALGDHYDGGVSTRKRLLNRSQLNKLRRRSGQKPLTKRDYAASTWLELQFGWLPILDDIRNIIEIVGGSLNSEADGVLSFAGYGFVQSEAQTSVTLSALEQSMSGASTVYPVGTFDGVCHIKYAVHAVYKADNSLIGILAQLGLTNPFEVVWELVPFSFVIDWILPIGSWISSLQADAGLELLQYTESKKVLLDGIIEVELKDINRYYTGEDPFVLVDKSVTTRHEIPFKMETFNRVDPLADEIPPMPLPQLSFSELIQPWKLVTSLSLLRAVT